MKDNVNFILNMFLKMLKESNLGFAVTVNGDIIFNDIMTGEKLYIKKEDFIKAYDEI